jgi:hypothetical protein
MYEKYGERSPVLADKQGLILEYCMAKNMGSVSKELVAKAVGCCFGFHYNKLRKLR